MNNDTLRWIRRNWFLLVGLFLSFETAFLFGYLVLSDFPFWQFSDFTLMSWIMSQTMLFIVFAIPSCIFYLRLNLVEGMVPMRAILKASGLGFFIFCVSVFSVFILYFVRDLRPGLVGFISAIILVFFLYHPNETNSINSTNYRKLLRLLRSNPVRTWQMAIRPYSILMMKNCAWLLCMILFAWIGLLRFSHLANDNIQSLNINGQIVESAVVGRNSIGLIVRNDNGAYAIYPMESISMIALPQK